MSDSITIQPASYGQVIVNTTGVVGTITPTVTSASIQQALGYLPDNPTLSRNPLAHKSSHLAGSSDSLSPSDIGAAASLHTHTKSQITDLTLSGIATSGSWNDLQNVPPFVSSLTGLSVLPQSLGGTGATNPSGFVSAIGAQPLDADLTALAAGGIPVPASLGGTGKTSALTAADVGITISGNVQAYSSNLANYSAYTILPTLLGGTGSNNLTQARANLGLAIGTDVQAYDADLSSLAAGGIPVPISLGGTGKTIALTAADVGLTNPVAVSLGGTGAISASTARTNLGLAIGSNVQAWDTDLDQLATGGLPIPVSLGGTGVSATAATAFTPTLIGTSVNGTVTGVTNSSWYYKQGPIVFVTISYAWTGITGSPTGNMRFNGLPYAAASTLSGEQYIPIVDAGIARTAAGNLLCAKITPSQSYLDIYQYTTAAAGSAVPAAVAIDTAGTIYASFNYLV